MEFVAGVDLAKCVEKTGPLPAARACDFIRQAALGLEHAHQHGMVHRDIKPHNLMLASPVASAPGVVTVKVMDFGLALVAHETASEAGSSGVTGKDALIGTADYIAPEQAEDPHNADIRADIYSLGCSLFHLLLGRSPLEGGSHVQKLAAHLTGNLPLADLPASIPAELRTVLTKMVAIDPANRYQTPAEVAQALLPFVSKVPPGRVETAAPAPSMGPKPSPAGAKEKAAILRAVPAASPERAAPRVKKPSLKQIQPAERKRKLVVGAGVGAVALVLAVGLMVHRWLGPATEAGAWNRRMRNWAGARRIKRRSRRSHPRISNRPRYRRSSRTPSAWSLSWSREARLGSLAAGARLARRRWRSGTPSTSANTR